MLRVRHRAYVPEHALKCHLLKAVDHVLPAHLTAKHLPLFVMELAKRLCD